MNKDGSSDRLNCANQLRLAERELASFIVAVTELFGPEQARISADDWLEESELDRPPRSTSRDWRAVTVAASARLASRLIVARDRRAHGPSTDARVPPRPLSDCLLVLFRCNALDASDSY